MEAQFPPSVGGPTRYSRIRHVYAAADTVTQENIVHRQLLPEPSLERDPVRPSEPHSLAAAVSKYPAKETQEHQPISETHDFYHIYVHENA